MILNHGDAEVQSKNKNLHVLVSLWLRFKKHEVVTNPDSDSPRSAG